MKIITNKSLGFREMARLTAFINLMTENACDDCIGATFDYDLHVDEPIIITESGEWFQASDYCIAFDTSGNGFYI